MIPTPRRDDGKVVIRPYATADASALYALVRESLESLSYWLPWCDAGYAPADAESWIEHGVRVWNDRSEFPFGIFAAGSGALLGGVGLNRLNPRDRLANLGYWVGAAQRGRGIALHAARLAAGFGFAELGLIRIEIVVLPSNAASLRVADKLGAKREALARNRLMFQGKPSDAVVFSLIPEDFGANTSLGRTI